MHEYKARLIDLFHSFDTNGDGVLSRDEFSNGLQKLGMLNRVAIKRYDRAYRGLGREFGLFVITSTLHVASALNPCQLQSGLLVLSLTSLEAVF